MADGIVRQLLVALGVDADDKGLEKFDKALDATKSAMEVAVKVAAAVTGALAAVGYAAVSEADRVAQIGVEADRAAQAVGTSTQAYQTLQYAVEAVGGSADDLQHVLGILATKQQDAAGGSKEAAAAFGTLGIRLGDLKGKKPDEILLAVADAAKRTTDPTKRLAALTKLLGDDVAKKMVPLLMRGSAGIGALRREARELGIVLSDDAVRQSKAFAEEERKLGAVLEGVRDKIAIALLPTVTKYATTISDFLERHEGDVEAVAGVIRRWGVYIAGLGAGIGIIAAVVGGLLALGLAAAALAPLVTAVTALGAAIVGGGFLAGVAVIGAFLAALIPLPAAMAPAVAVLAAILLYIDDLWTYLEGGKSVIGDFIDEWKDTDTVLGAVARYIESLRRLIYAVSGAIGPATDDLEAFATRGLGAIRDEIEPLLPYLHELSDMADELAAKIPLLGPGFASGFFNGLSSVTNGASAGLESYAAGHGTPLPRTLPVGGTTTVGGSRSSSVQQTNNFHIQSTDPKAVVGEVAANQDRNHRSAMAALASGDR